MQLNKGQEKAIRDAIVWNETKLKQTFEIAGGPGTGKTTIAKRIVSAIGLSMDEVLFIAYVGKATLALARNGNKAQTLHSAVYDFIEMPIYEDDEPIMKSGRHVTKLTQVKKTSLNPSIKLLMLDEGAMVNEELGRDLLSFGLPIIVLGDIDQLPPIFGKSFFLQHPDVILTELMRQAEGSPIIYLSQLAKAGKPMSYGKYGDDCYVIPKSKVTDSMLLEADVVICRTNRTRSELNAYVRNELLKITKPQPVIGDKMICRQNNRSKILRSNPNIYLVNGLIGYVTDVHLDAFNGRALPIDFRPEFIDDEEFFRIPIDYAYLLDPFSEKSKGRSFYNKFEYAYAITCHLAQGSQYDNVLIIGEPFPNRAFYNKWLYTAITRAVKTVIIAI